MTHQPKQEKFVHTGAELAALWRELMGSGGFGGRSLWHVFIEPNGRVSPLIVPIDDLPHEPDRELVGNLRYVISEVLSDGPNSSVAVLLSRPGSVGMTQADRRWARAVTTALGPDLSPWPMHLATTDNVTMFAPDDLIGA